MRNLERNLLWAYARGDAAWSLGAPAPQRAGVLAVLALLCATVAYGVVAGGGEKWRTGRQSPASSATVIDTSAFRTEGPVEHSYVPGQGSGWHSHPGLHHVTVLSGRLTVYGSECEPSTYGRGEAHLGGGDGHLARNESDASLEMSVAYLVRPGQSPGQYRVEEPAPPTCALA